MLQAPRFLILAALFAAGCCSTCPAPPEPDLATPERLVANLRHYVKEECWSESYDLLSELTRNENSYAKWRLGAPGLTFPGTDILVRDILINGETVSIAPGPRGAKAEGEKLWIFQDNIEDGERRCRLFNFLLIREGSPPRWTFGLQDQQSRNIPICGE